MFSEFVCALYAHIFINLFIFRKHFILVMATIDPETILGTLETRQWMGRQSNTEGMNHKWLIDLTLLTSM